MITVNRTKLSQHWGRTGGGSNTINGLWTRQSELKDVEKPSTVHILSCESTTGGELWTCRHYGAGCSIAC